MADKEGNGNGSKASRALIASGYMLPWLASAVLVWYITTKETPRRLEKTEAKIEVVTERVGGHDVSIKVLESELGHIRTGIARIETAISRLDRRRRTRP